MVQTAPRPKRAAADDDGEEEAAEEEEEEEDTRGWPYIDKAVMPLLVATAKTWMTGVVQQLCALSDLRLGHTRPALQCVRRAFRAYRALTAPGGRCRAHGGGCVDLDDPGEALALLAELDNQSAGAAIPFFFLAADD